jgi:lipid-binding SYLF domain-containing protein
MNKYTRRFLIAGAVGTTLFTAACGNVSNPITVSDAATIDARSDAALEQLFEINPNAREVHDIAAGILIMPLVTEAGFGIGGSYGRGALRVGGASVDYYSATEASLGLQIGGQQYSHVLFFMTETALAAFRSGDGFVAGADLKVAMLDAGVKLNADTTTTLAPVVGMSFGQAGIIAGVTVEGTKYTLIQP